MFSACKVKISVLLVQMCSIKKSLFGFMHFCCILSLSKFDKQLIHDTNINRRVYNSTRNSSNHNSRQCSFDYFPVRSFSLSIPIYFDSECSTPAVPTDLLTD